MEIDKKTQLPKKGDSPEIDLRLSKSLSASLFTSGIISFKFFVFVYNLN